MKYIIYISSIVIFIASCKPGNSNNQSIVDEPEQLQYPNADTLSIDIDRSVITWIGSKPTGQHDGIIGLLYSFLILNENKIIGGEINIDINSLKVMDIKPNDEKNKKLSDHLMSEDFFDSQNFPKGKFEIIEIKPFDTTYQITPNETVFPSKYQPASADKFTVNEPNYIVYGNLTLKNVIQSVSFPAKIKYSVTKITAEAKFNINRTKWNLSYNDESSIIDKAKDKFIYNTVNVGFLIELPLQD